MEATPEGLAAAAAAREALKQKKRSLEVGTTWFNMDAYAAATLFLCCAPPLLPPLVPPRLLLAPRTTSPCSPSAVMQQSGGTGVGDGTQAGAGHGAGATKKAAPERPPPSCTHEVAVPPDFDVAAAEAALDPELHGGLWTH